MKTHEIKLKLNEKKNTKLNSITMKPGKLFLIMCMCC